MSARCWHAAVFCFCSALLVEPSAARATFHEWRFAEIYSNASGTVQFIELADPDNGETQMQGIKLRSNGHEFTFPTNLPPGTPTAGHRLLLATPGYFNLLGVPAADYNLGVNGFFATSGDSLVYAGGLDTLTFTAAQLPTDAVRSLVRTTPTGGSPVSTATNSPTNVGGTSGVFPPWENQDNRFDVSDGGDVTPLDLLQVINELIANGIHDLAPPDTESVPPPFVDVNGSNTVSPLDALQVINFLSGVPTGGLLPLASRLSATVPEPSSFALAMFGAAWAGAMGLLNRKRLACREKIRSWLPGSTQGRGEAL